MNDEFNKGYFGYGSSPKTYDAQQGEWARQRDERQQAERQSREAQSRSDASSRAWMSMGSTASTVPNQSYTHTDSSSSPATFGGTVKGTATAGLVLCLAYAYYGLHLAAWGPLGRWAVLGLIGGALAGVVLYAAIVALRAMFKLLAFMLSVLLGIAGISIVLYFISPKTVDAMLRWVMSL